jgi:hypothetical protein
MGGSPSELDGGLGSVNEGGLLFGDGGIYCPAGQTLCKAICCTADQICLEDSCKDLGPECDELWPCAKGFYCDKDLKRCVPGASKCIYQPPVGSFSPKVEWQWTGGKAAPSHSQVMMAPMVANLTDDNGDGKIDRDDVPDIVFNTFAAGDYWGDGVLRAISGDGKKEHWAVLTHKTTPGAGVAIADIDGDLKPEVVTCGASKNGGTIGRVLAFEHDGSFKWQSAGNVICGFASPAIADLDGDGKAEVVVRYSVLEGATGVTRWQGKAISSGTSAADYTTVADLDEDGRPEVVGGNVVYRHDGQVWWQDASRPDGYPAIADLDGDGKPEIVTASSSDHSLRAHRHDGTKYWGPKDINQGKADTTDKCNGCGGGPPTIADFDGDGKPEIAAAAGYGYVVFEHDGSSKWFQKTKDLSSRVTGSSVFDFEGDGKAEVVYGDEHMLRIYDGGSGAVLFSQCNTSGTLWEYPVIVDVDNDGHAEIVVSNNNYAFSTCSSGSASVTGIKVIADAQNNWVKTRRIWNQHTYHVTNIDEDGRVPKAEPRNWDNSALNNFRQNVQPNGIFDAPDLTGKKAPALDGPTCAAKVKAHVLVQNNGAAKVMPGLQVTLYGKPPGGAAQALGTAATKTTLLPGQSETVSFDLLTPKALQGQVIELYAEIDDDGTGKGHVNECDELNNQVILDSTIKCDTLE